MFFLLSALAFTLPQVQRNVPDRQPGLALFGKEPVMVFGSGQGIWLTRAAPDTGEFEKPVKVAEVPDLMLGRHRGPRVIAAGRKLVVTAISGGERGDLLAWHSDDGGKRWKGPVTVNDEPKAAREGLHNLSANHDGVVAAVWLDLRTPRTKIYASYSSDGGASWSKNTLLYASPTGTVCQCCHPSIASVGRDAFAVMFRNLVNGNRDLYSLRWIPGSIPSPVEKMGTGTWPLNACPMDGGGIADENGTLVSAWRRERQVFLAKRGEPEKQLGEGKDVALAVTRAGASVAWTTSDGAVVIHLPGEMKAPLQLDEKGAYPTLLGLPNGAVLAAWESGDTIRTNVVHSEPVLAAR